MNVFKISLAVTALIVASLGVASAQAGEGWRAYHYSTFYGGPYARTRVTPNTTAYYPYAPHGMVHYPTQPRYYAPAYYVDPTIYGHRPHVIAGGATKEFMYNYPQGTE